MSECKHFWSAWYMDKGKAYRRCFYCQAVEQRS